MSAFVVDPKTINRILGYLRAQARQRQHIATNAKRELGACEFEFEDQEDAANLGLALYNLNIHAVSQRYPADTLNTLPGTYLDDQLCPYLFERVEGVSSIQAFKSMQCLTYQMSEGNVPESKLYKALETIESAICRHIVTNLPEYDKAVWE